MNLFCLWKQDAAEEVIVLFMVVICLVAYGVFITIPNGAFLMFFYFVEGGKVTKMDFRFQFPL